jgi:hypothetical protein
LVSQQSPLLIFGRWLSLESEVGLGVSLLNPGFGQISVQRLQQPLLHVLLLVRVSTSRCWGSRVSYDVLTCATRTRTCSPCRSLVDRHVANDRSKPPGNDRHPCGEDRDARSKRADRSASPGHGILKTNLTAVESGHNSDVELQEHLCKPLLSIARVTQRSGGKRIVAQMRKLRASDPLVILKEEQ